MLLGFEAVKKFLESIMNKEVNSVVSDFKNAHKEMLDSIENSKYGKVDKLIQRQQDILDKFFKHIKKECNIPTEAKHDSEKDEKTA